MAVLSTDTVVVPIDFSDESFEALHLADDLVANSKSIHLIHVLFELSAGEPAMVWGVMDEGERTAHATLAIREKLDPEKHHDVHIEIAYGDPGAEIASYAEKVDADLIVLPSHGRTGLKRLMIGSVAERVVRLAHCPVLVLRK